MKFTAIHTYQGDTEKIFRMLTDQNSHINKYEKAGCKNIIITERSEKDGKIIIRSTRDAPSTAPGFAKKILGAYNTMIQEDIWEISDKPVKKGSFSCKVKGAPVTISGDFELRPKSVGCEIEMKMDLKVNVPLIGGKIEPFLKGDTQAALNSDEAFFQEYEKTYE
ncbi:MAG: DUF2505 domain-containing protein [Desulfobacterales bacterium]|nr:DUF2505 domain-containing protein [Desulfobacterales bacterium]